MNERIKELAREHFCRIEYDNGNVYECYEFSEQELEKFAELIVMECADIVADAVDHREPASTYVDKIKQHFGVEE